MLEKSFSKRILKENYHLISHVIFSQESLLDIYSTQNI